MWRKIDVKWIVVGLLVLHVGWIANHIRWVLNEEINPWKLGGYAMYTVPSPNLRIRVYDALNPEIRIPVKMLQFEAATRFTNGGRTFRCAGIPERSLRAFFDENKDLIGRSLVFVYFERSFVRSPPSAKMEQKGLVVVTWRDSQTFSYTSRFCGKDETASVSLPEAAAWAALPRLP
ncbi:hypothetical protein [Taklimakanibacter deserti]|uniref:hypothetical protein n=1 Tax=Taklimakanibacter deserti TaxID=2267839 RepID=UPI000E65CDE4